MNKVDYKTAYETVMIANKMLEQENKQLKEKIDILLEDNNQLEEIRIKTIEYIKNEMPYLEEPDDDYENNHKMIEYDRNVLLEILGDKE